MPSPLAQVLMPWLVLISIDTLAAAFAVACNNRQPYQRFFLGSNSQACLNASRVLTQSRACKAGQVPNTAAQGLQKPSHPPALPLACKLYLRYCCCHSIGYQVCCV